MPSEMTSDQGLNNKIWIGIVVGAAVGLGIALARRNRRSRWDDVTKRFGERSADFADTTREIADRIKTIYEEGRKVVEEAGELWGHGKRIVGY
jgi:hypothetical protein